MWVSHSDPPFSDLEDPSFFLFSGTLRKPRVKGDSVTCAGRSLFLLAQQLRHLRLKAHARSFSFRVFSGLGEGFVPSNWNWGADPWRSPFMVPFSLFGGRLAKWNWVLAPHPLSPLCWWGCGSEAAQVAFWCRSTQTRLGCSPSRGLWAHPLNQK